jgi:hypothetical protein
MAHYPLTEPVIQALTARLGTDLPATIAEINATAATVADGYTITMPTVFDFIPQLELQTSYPMIGIQDLPTVEADDIGSSVTTEVGLGIVTFVADPDQRALAWRLRRYLQAVITVALAGRNLGAAAYGTRFRRIVPGPTLDVEGDPRTWVSWASVEITALRSD